MRCCTSLSRIVIFQGLEIICDSSSYISDTKATKHVKQDSEV